jgi:tetratricopeptide (TPR) repeat protein
MSTLARVVALCALSSSIASFAASPPKRVEPPLTCNAASRPFFAHAWEALSNVHLDEARELFGQTVAVDPACVLAWAHLGALTPGVNGRRMVDDAVGGMSAVSEVEQLQVLALAAQHRGDDERELALLRQARDLAPRTYELNFALAQRAGVKGLWSEAAIAARRAADLDPDRGAAWNVLGYAHLGLGEHADAIAAFERYAATAPGEPNAFDSLGDALLANNQLDEAKAAYQRALDVSSGSFWASGHGIATVCAIQQDWFCARAAIEKARRSMSNPDDRLRLMEWTAWSYLADAQPQEAFRALEDLENSAKAGKLEAHQASATVLRGRFLVTLGRYRDAVTVLSALGKKKFSTLTDAQRLAIDTSRLHDIAEAQARLGNLGDAEKTLAQLRTLYDFRPRDPRGIDAVSHTRGLIALQKKDPAMAISAFMQCSKTDETCRLDLAEAQLAAGDAPAAALTRTAISRANHREPEYWWARVQAAKKLRATQPPRDDRSAF